MFWRACEEIKKKSINWKYFNREKPNINININANLEILVPFLKNILLYAIKLEASFNPSWKKIKVDRNFFFFFFNFFLKIIKN